MVWAAREVADCAAVYFIAGVVTLVVVLVVVVVAEGVVVVVAAGSGDPLVPVAGCAATGALAPAHRPVCHPEQRLFSGTPRRALSLCAPQPPQVARPH